MNQLKLFWSFLQGKKTIIAALYWGTALPALALLYPLGVPPDINKWFVIVGMLLSSIGLGSKWAKRQIEKQENNE